MRKLLLVLAIGLVASACGGSPSSSDSSEATAAPTTAAVERTDPPSSQAPDTEARSASEAPPVSEAPSVSPSFTGPPAPDFDLALANGGTFSLTDEQKPTYVVFWAEW